jgi:hypothetical protein
MAQEIKPTYVTFEQAKWLKEKDYPQKNCNNGYNLDGQDSFEYTIDWLNANAIAKPEQWQVVEWLLQTYKIDVDVSANRVLHTEKAKGYIAEIYTPKVCVPNWELGGNHKNREEAYSAAFDYILKELI